MPTVKGIICFVMALIIFGGCAWVYFAKPSEDIGITCAIIAFVLGGGLISAGVKLFGLDIDFWNYW